MTRNRTFWKAAPMAAFCLSIAAACLLTGCGSSTETMQKKLEKIAGEDLKDILAEVPG